METLINIYTCMCRHLG